MGAAMIAKKSFIEEIGLFDPKYFYYYDDDYLSFKTWLAGKRVVTVPTSKVHHVGSGTSDNAQSIYFNFKHSTIGAVSLNLDIYKNAGDILRGFFALWVHDFYRAFGEILAHRRACKFMGDFSAYRWTLSNFRYIWRKRINYWGAAKIDDKQLKSKMIRIHIPLPVYFIPNLLTRYYENTAKAYEKTVLLNS
jgi:GT2 family glycosyltransferase